MLRLHRISPYKNSDVSSVRYLGGMCVGKYYVDVRTLQYLHGIQYKNNDVSSDPYHGGMCGAVASGSRIFSCYDK